MGVVGEFRHVEGRIGSHTCTADCRNGHDGFNSQFDCCFDLAAGMVALVKQDGEVVGAKDGLGSSDHVSHGLGIVVVRYFEVDGNVVFGISGGLDVVGDFGDVVSYDHLPTVGVGGGDLFLIAVVQPLTK